MREVPTIVFTDTSVLINLYRAERLDLITDLLGEHATWTGSMRAECCRKEWELGLPGLARGVERLLGEPMLPRDDEHVRIRQLRTQMAEPGDHPSAHLGEAETITIVTARRLKAIFATDDRAAAMHAAPTRCVTTWELVRLAVRRDLITAAEAGRIWEVFLTHGGRPPRTISEAGGFVAWLNGAG